MRGVRNVLLVIAFVVSWVVPGATQAQERQTVEANPPSEAIREARTLLTALGYKPGPAGEGVWNERLSKAWRSFLRDAGLPASDVLTPRGLRRLREVARAEGVGGAGASEDTGPALAPDRLHRAVIAGDIEGVRKLLSDGTPVDDRDSRGWTPLMHASHRGYVLLVEMLLRSGASPDIRAADGATALFIATMNAHPEAIALLMRAGASVSIRGPRGLTAVDVARLVYGEKKGQRPVPDDAEVRALLGGMTWAEAVEAAVAGLKAKPEDSRRPGSPKQERAGSGPAEPRAAGRTVPQPTPSPESAAAVEKALALTRAQRMSVQKVLSALGFDAGTADGVFGRRTRAAIRKWQTSRGGAPTGHLNAKTIRVLLAAGARRASAEQKQGRKVQAAPEENQRRRQAELTPGRVFRDCPECPEMVVLPAGSFTMGSPPGEEGRIGNEGPQRRVTIRHPFAVGKYEVTFAEWDACVSAGGCRHRPDDEGWGRDRRPVINVNWENARGYVRWLSRRTGKRYRLLSEAEWEYAARAGTTTRYHWGDGIGRDRANCLGCGSGENGWKTIPVGSYLPNAFGLHDVHGNVAEWVEDCYSDSHARAPSDGSPWKGGDCSLRVVRDGGEYGPRYMRSARRAEPHSFVMTSGLHSIGFRVARTLSP